MGKRGCNKVNWNDRNSSNYSTHSNLLYFFLPLFLILTSFYLLIVGMEGYFCTLSYSVIHTHRVGFLWTKDRPVAETST